MWLLIDLVRQALIEKDEDRQLKESRKCWWGIDSMKAFAQLMRTHAREFQAHGIVTADFTTMYTAFPHDLVLHRIRDSLAEAWQWVSENHSPLQCDEQELHLSKVGWTWEGAGYTLDEVMHLVEFSLRNNFTLNGGKLRLQKRGFPQGLEWAPLGADLACYPVERNLVLNQPIPSSSAVCRYIDDLGAAGNVVFPSSE